MNLGPEDSELPRGLSREVLFQMPDPPFVSHRLSDRQVFPSAVGKKEGESKLKTHPLVPWLPLEGNTRSIPKVEED